MSIPALVRPIPTWVASCIHALGTSPVGSMTLDYIVDPLTLRRLARQGNGRSAGRNPLSDSLSWFAVADVFLFDSSPRYESTRVVDDFAKDKRSFWSHYATQLNANRRNCSPAGSFAALIETRCQFFGHLSLFLVHSFPQFLWGILC